MTDMIVGIWFGILASRTRLIGFLFCLFGMLIVGGGCASSSSEKERELSLASSIGVVDTRWLLAESKLGKKVTESLNEFMKDRQALIELEQKELMELESNLLRQRNVLNPSAKQEREDQFRQRMVGYQEKVTKLNLEVQTRQVKLFSEFQSSVDAVVAQVAKRQGLALVLEKGENSPTRYHQSALNVSKEVLEEMDRGD